jgi:phosphoribosylaminoimidazole (AIR) synthetase
MDNSSLSILYIIISLASFLLFDNGLTLVRPLVEYTSTVWNPYMKTEINKIEAVQRRAARYVINNQRNR